MAKPRREFLGWLGASTVLAATGGSPLHARAPGQMPAAGPGGPVPVGSKWDVGWTDPMPG